MRGYDLPAWVGQSTLVVASSHSGNTEETISALSPRSSASAPVAAISTGGALGDGGSRVDLPLLPFPDESACRARRWATRCRC